MDEGSVPNEEIVLLKGKLVRVGRHRTLLLLSETQVKERENSKPTVLSVTVLCTLCGKKKSVMKSDVFDATCCTGKKREEA